MPPQKPENISPAEILPPQATAEQVRLPENKEQLTNQVEAVKPVEVQSPLPETSVPIQPIETAPQTNPAETATAHTVLEEVNVPNREAAMYDGLAKIAETDPAGAVDALAQWRKKELVARFGVAEDLPGIEKKAA